MFKRIATLFLIFMIISLMGGCINKPNQKVGMVKQLNDKNVGVITGTVADTLISSVAKNARISYHSDLDEAVNALKEEKLDAVVYDEPILRNIAASNSDLIILSELISNESYALATRSKDKELLKNINSRIELLKKDNSLDEMKTRWMTELGGAGSMPDISSAATKGILKFGVPSNIKPFSYLENGEIIGYDIELARRIAKQLGMKLEIINMTHDKLVPSLIQGNVDFIGGGLTIDNQKENDISFSQPTYQGGFAVLIKK